MQKFQKEISILGLMGSLLSINRARFWVINVSAKDKQLVKALGFEGLYDSPQDALKPLMRLA